MRPSGPTGREPRRCCHRRTTSGRGALPFWKARPFRRGSLVSPAPTGCGRPNSCGGSGRRRGLPRLHGRRLHYGDRNANRGAGNRSFLVARASDGRGGRHGHSGRRRCEGNGNRGTGHELGGVSGHLRGGSPHDCEPEPGGCARVHRFGRRSTQACMQVSRPTIS